MASIINSPVRDQNELYEEINRLAEENRATCLWFMSDDYLPETTEARLRVLRHLERHGDRDTFVKARRLRDCLLQNSNEKSVRS
jgi:hypothetical protein